MLIVGIDEAGRGPCIGPLVMCGVKIDEKDRSKLVNMGVKDSKLLSHKTREFLVAKIKDVVHSYKIVVVDPPEIDEAVMLPNTNLNQLEAVKSAEIINALRPDRVILDCPSINLDAYSAEVQRFLEEGNDPELRVEHKADLNYPECAAASILAKVKRDELIALLKEKCGADFGSGYASDPMTIIFLEENWNNADYMHLFRKSWESWKRLKRNKAQLKLANWSQKW